MKADDYKIHLEHLRHSTAHLFAAAVLNLWPDTKLTIGPAIENGFYYDFDFGSHKISEEDFPKLEQKMHELVKNWKSFEKIEVSEQEAKEKVKGNPYKEELITDIVAKGEPITFYKSGDFEDLCRGGHCQHPSEEIKHFKLLSVAGAYWRGSEKNKMLTRIYGTAFTKQEELDKYLWQQVEAKKRDHRKIGQEMDLFTFSDNVGPGLPLWMPKGTIIREEIENWAKETEKKLGYVRVSTPHIAKHNLFEISGHLPYYKDDMYSPMDIEGEEYYLKGMNCPMHHMIYKARPKSYKDLPLKLAEYGTVYRHELSGTLYGLMRVRSLCQNDAHIYCTREQAEEEFLNVIKLHEYYYNTLGLTKDDYYIVLSLPDESKRDKYHGDKQMWDDAEKMMRSAIEKSGIRYEEDPGGAAFYGPKIDFNIKSVTGRVFGISTNQLDLYMPTRFNLSYIDKDGSEKLCVVIHRAPLGSHERFVGFLIEHFAGKFPLWLAPVQLMLIPIADRHLETANKMAEQLKNVDIRVEVDGRSETLQARIREATLQKVPFMGIIGDKEIENTSISLRSRDGTSEAAVPISEVIHRLKKDIDTKI